MRLVRGIIKVQHGIYRIYEMLEMSVSEQGQSFHKVAGYSVFDLEDQQQTEAVSHFMTAVHVIEELVRG